MQKHSEPHTRFCNWTISTITTASIPEWFRKFTNTSDENRRFRRYFPIFPKSTRMYLKSLQNKYCQIPFKNFLDIFQWFSKISAGFSNVHFQSSQVFQRGRYLGGVGSRRSGACHPKNVLKFALFKSLEMHQFLKRWTFRPSMKALKKAVFKDETQKQ